MFSPSLFKLLHLQSNKHVYKHNTKQKNSKENIKQTGKNNIHLPARPLEIFIFRGGSWAGNHVFQFLFKMFFFECLCFLFLCLFLFFIFKKKCFRLVFLSFCIYNRKKHIQKHNKQQKDNRQT